MIAVVTLWIGGRPYRWATEQVDVEADDGFEETIADGLIEATVDEAGEDSPGGATVKISTGGVDIALLVSLGHQVAGAIGELAEVESGDEWSARKVRVYGVIGDVGYGELGIDDLELSIGATWRDGGLIPPAGASVDEATWPNAQERANGKGYPFVFGQPASARGLVVDTTGDGVALVAGHAVRAATVRVRDRAATTPAWSTLSVYAGVDGRGRSVSLVTLPAPIAEDTADLEVDWSLDDGGYPGVGATAPRALPDVQDLVLRLATVPVDRASFRSATWARAYLIDTYVDEPTSPLELAIALLEGIPGRLEAGPKGIRLLPDIGALPEATGPGGPILDLDNGIADLAGRVDVVGSTVPGVVQVRYALDAISGDPQARAVLTVGRGPRAARRAGAEGTLGEAVVEIVAGHVGDPATAWRIASATARAAYSRREIEIDAPTLEPYSALQTGDLVRVTRGGLYLDEHPARVERVEREIGEERLLIRLRLIDDPPT